MGCGVITGGEDSISRCFCLRGCDFSEAGSVTVVVAAATAAGVFPFVAAAVAAATAAAL